MILAHYLVCVKQVVQQAYGVEVSFPGCLMVSLASHAPLKGGSVCKLPVLASFNMACYSLFSKKVHGVSLFNHGRKRRRMM